MTSISYSPSKSPDGYEKYQNWTTAIGLQAVDGLKPSKYLVKLANEHIAGKRTVLEVEFLINDYYNSLEADGQNKTNRQVEADLVATRIEKILESGSFVLDENSLKNIHKKLFTGWKEYLPGEYRTYDIFKNEWVLDGDTVQYGHWADLTMNINSVIENEKKFNYSGRKIAQKISHLADFTSKLWVQHGFLEGNTRTLAILLILYLRSIGFKVDNEPFEKHSLYFRNALVRANYVNGIIGINPEIKFLMRFLENLLNNKSYQLKNRYLHIFWDSDNVTQNVTQNVTVEIVKLIKEDSKTTVDAMAETIGVNRRTVLRHLKKLQENDKIVREGSDKTGMWIIKKERA